MTATRTPVTRRLLDVFRDAGATSPYALILEHGREYEPAPLDERLYERGRVKECFRNALQLAQEHADLTYVEGYAHCGMFPMHHAWCVDADGRVVDPTWREEGASPVDEWEYLGVPITTEYALTTVVRKKTWGVLDAAWICEDGLPEEAIA